MIRDISPDILPDKYLEKSFQKKKENIATIIFFILQCEKRKRENEL